ncbi:MULTISPECIES: hypothetical protein [unclassified Nocardioides]|uniref:hypothetical protein n=1 Tax=unclassified Nocardioides TaxID=2615069 RepID=UPI0009EFB140|nr:MULTISPECIES: hypothetical protein [unclassified Nocardioides]GAW53816.1 Cob(I)yrinic acid a,c-diamide adenosyltransferase [Nocardioides sp. PD653]
MRKFADWVVKKAKSATSAAYGTSCRTAGRGSRLALELIAACSGGRSLLRSTGVETWELVKESSC